MSEITVHPDVYPTLKKLRLTCRSCPDCIKAAETLKPEGYNGVEDLNQSPRSSTMTLNHISKWKEQSSLWKAVPETITASYDTQSSLPKMILTDSEKTIMRVVEVPETGETKYYIGEQEVSRDQFVSRF